MERKNRQRCQTSKCTFVATGTKCRSAQARSVARAKCKKRCVAGQEDLWAEKTLRGRGGGPARLAMFGLAGADSHAQAMHYWQRKITKTFILHPVLNWNKNYFQCRSGVTRRQQIVSACIPTSTTLNFQKYEFSMSKCKDAKPEDS